MGRSDIGRGSTAESDGGGSAWRGITLDALSDQTVECRNYGAEQLIAGIGVLVAVRRALASVTVVNRTGASEADGWGPARDSAGTR
ncbi:hypothetical protein Aca07nite_64130 [Actinoplanes capillaceus]|uniref:Uncharacterized protein n=1 Tax=Actinoplanes campanulatus TaxID=113559 RepID=A0ABQ3WS66_9ACTN|nr:hypothetical protein Aca07nite_64130 [Actinoplanes capillaceus]